ncbi:MAG: hypothetical protein SO083_05715 [Megamonas funiformis]|uniref:hypothetical protein n=1 Tax=Megamonas funiformis TaxID=437897 RepID=UPI002A7FF247|nr:hypothetical protein [Megamonas funiformis]MDY3874644.1 hypothetical protein [Megamonas funiformis]
METWIIMLGCQVATAVLSLGVVLNFMYKKEPLDEVDVQIINETKQINVKETHAMGV